MNAKENAVVHHYAQSFVDKVSDTEEVWAIFDDIAKIISVMKENDLDNLLHSESISTEKKGEFVRVIRKSQYRIINDLIETVLLEGNISLLSKILEDILRRISQNKNEFDAHIASVYPLSDAQKEKICSLVEKRFDLKVRNVVEELDKSLLGGFVISVNHRIIDASVRTQLREIKSKL